jgi:uncharacterized circularly permuted ATP-grasp superfamily protein
LKKVWTQRVTALNRFIHDCYHDQEIFKAGLVPSDQLVGNAQFRPEMVGVEVAGGIYSHISGVDIVRALNAEGQPEYYVLEDNLRVPSGVSYMLENRKMTMRLFPELFGAHKVAPVDHYPDLLLETLRESSPATTAEPTVVVLTPGMHNSAYFEHAFLAQQMGVELVEGQDLFTKDKFLYMRTTRGPQRVDVIYRRVDDDFLDPDVFRSDSALGCAGLMEVYRAGHVTICNAVGTGIADDKSIYPYVPKMIEFYLGEKPLLSNVPTLMCRNADDLMYTLDNLKDLVVKEVHGAGGYGMLVGPAATKAEIAKFAEVLRAYPSDRYIAQPTLSLSSCPTFVESGIAPRHIDLRPVCAQRQEGPDGPWRPDPGGTQGGFAGRQFLTGWRAPRTPGCSKTMTSHETAQRPRSPTIEERKDRHAQPNRRPSVLDVPLYRAGREHRPFAGRQLPDLAAAPIGGEGAGGLAGTDRHQRTAAGLHREIRGRQAPGTSWTSW